MIAGTETAEAENVVTLPALENGGVAKTSEKASKKTKTKTKTKKAGAPAKTKPAKKAGKTKTAAKKKTAATKDKKAVKKTTKKAAKKKIATKGAKAAKRTKRIPGTKAQTQVPIAAFKYIQKFAKEDGGRPADFVRQTLLEKIDRRAGTTFAKEAATG